ncbi:unnamed protein product [Adineta ricciae]|uniref:RRM domain-containing protein n=1 Tax=Adineta ricciae TaxID=249248 RepID=A0A815SHB5_ADIRI|nr:unnamed protein product [Adineta ricciae]CAF1493006.1 unnamed protein product [Adineta ricciae]
MVPSPISPACIQTPVNNNSSNETNSQFESETFVYAFILHRTAHEAEMNLRRPIDLQILGSECQIEYAGKCISRANISESIEQKKVIVRQIPENITEQNLYELFRHCQILKYCPAVDLSSQSIMKTDDHILPGYAVLLFNSKEQAIHAIQNTSKYEINGKQLTVALCRS